MYRMVLWLAFPRRLRRTFGDEMLRLFEEQRAHVRAVGGSLRRLWIDAIVDAAVQGTAERLARVEQTGMWVVRELGRWRCWMHALIHDVRYAARMFVKQPGVTVIAVLTLALGIGANTAIFSAVDAVLLRPLPYDEPDSLVKVWEKRHREGVLDNVVSPADFLDWTKMNGAFEAMAAYTGSTVDLTGAGEPIRLSAGLVSTPFFDILRISPALGRSFRPEEGKVGQHRVVILNHGLWERRYGSNPGMIGQKLVLNGIPHEVVGVLPRSFEFPDRAIELWMPLAYDGAPQAPPRTNHFLQVYARLKDGVTLERARAEMDRVGAELSRQYPEANRNHGAHVSPLRDELTGPVRTGLLLLLAAVAFVLLIACVNVANLLLARAASRRREMAVRSALGAGRGRLAGQSLTESLVLALTGGLAGLIVAYWGIEIVRGLTPAELPVIGVDRLALNTRLLIFTFGLSIATGLLFGLLPAWHLSGQNVSEFLKDGSRAAGGVRRRVRVVLVVGEIALAALLLVGTGLTLRSFYTLLKAESGIRTERVLTAFVALPGARYSGEERLLATFEEIERRLAAIPGVRHAGVTSHLPLTGQDSRSGIGIEGREPTPDAPTRAHPRAVSVDYFAAMGIPLLQGRGFTLADGKDAPLVAIVNETMAARYWPGSSPIGRRFRLGGTNAFREVIGIVRDVRHWGLDLPVNPEFYLPQRQMVWQNHVNYVLHTDADPAAIAGALREQLRAVDPDLPLSNVRTMDQVAARSVASRRSSMLLLAIFGALALVLAAAGIYGVMAHLVAVRTSEIGVRMTLGARPADVLKLVLREGLVQATLGLTAGMIAGVWVMRTFSTLLYGIQPADPLTLAAVAVILVGTALAACLIPARRAMRVDPVQALRST
jgi:predicted permease